MLSYRQFFLLFLFLLSFIHLSAQEVNPVTRFHTYGSPYVDYNDNFFSGFMQSADSRQKGGFLQMPFIGNPVLVYIGEKDSTQFMAYASGYEFQQRHPETGHYAVDITRYGVHVETESTPTTLIQRFTFPDTTAVKGFLLDIDNSGSGKGNEDMNVYFIDKRTIRAYKRGNDDGSAGQYYYARFSHPFDSWNVRRERVTLSDGRKEARCKAAFTFPLKQGEQLIVRSSVSSVSSDLAYTRVEGKAPGHHFDDKRYIFNNDQSQVTQTTNSSKSTTSQSSRKPNPASPVRDQTRQPVPSHAKAFPILK